MVYNDNELSDEENKKVSKFCIKSTMFFMARKVKPS